MRLRNVLTLAAAVFACVLTGSHAKERHLLQGTFTYANAERTSYYRFRDGYAVGGSIFSRRGSPSDDILFGETVGTEVDDCSDLKYRCVKTGKIVFAVPRDFRHLTSSYGVQGVAFTMVECLRKTGKVCDVFLMKVDCQQIASPRTCAEIAGGRHKAPNAGPLWYFIFNADFGVTSFGFVDEELSDKAWVAKVARELILRDEVGILGK